MDISYFKEFVILAETKNFWEASEQIFISQSSLSKHIKSLESSLGAPLFDRSTRRVELTEFGKMMLPYAQNISRVQHNFERAAFNFLHQEESSLTIATIPEMAHYNIIDILFHFRNDHPTVHLTLMEVDSFVSRELLLNQKCELAIMRESENYIDHDPDKERHLVKIPLMKDRLIAVLPPGHPLASDDAIELSSLSNEDFALIPEDTVPYKICINACQNAGFVPHVVFTTHNLESILDMVRKGNCAALLFENHVDFPHKIHFNDKPPFVPVKLKHEVLTTICLSYNRDVPLSPSAQYFAEYCKTFMYVQP